jgi:transcriptional regulator with XRE-family HTH domain
MPEPFGVFLRNRRRELGLTQRQVAAAVGLKSIAFLSDIESGYRRPSRDLFPLLAQILKLDVETLEAHDIRTPLGEARSLLLEHPEYAVAFRKVVEHSRELGADEVLRRIESSDRNSGCEEPDRVANTRNQDPPEPYPR